MSTVDHYLCCNLWLVCENVKVSELVACDGELHVW